MTKKVRELPTIVEEFTPTITRLRVPQESSAKGRVASVQYTIISGDILPFHLIARLRTSVCERYSPLPAMQANEAALMAQPEPTHSAVSVVLEAVPHVETLRNPPSCAEGGRSMRSSDLA